MGLVTKSDQARWLGIQWICYGFDDEIASCDVPTSKGFNRSSTQQQGMMGRSHVPWHSRSTDGARDVVASRVCVFQIRYALSEQAE